ncbi:MAG: amino acid ABC transporter substrate-binding protein [Gammaproteobacteria bacterium]|nr:amino acid ABC transporter substrate-binding protein [Gammaproteobacteria bacterium]
MRRMIVAFSALFMMAITAHAAELSGTLKQIAESGQIRIGYVPDAPPMSFVDREGQPVGYSITLCRSVAAAARLAAGLEEIEVVYVPLVSMEERLGAVEDGKVDIECGATTVTLSRRERVDFTLMTFITGGAVLSRKSKPINSISDLDGKTVAVIEGTTTHASIRDFMELNEMKSTLRIIETHDEGMKLLNEKKVDGYATDRAMLIGQVHLTGKTGDYVITRDVFSFEPYAFMTRRGDTEFRLVADRALANLYRGARIRRIYHNWFGRYGESLSPIVSAIYEFQAVTE